MLDIYDYIDKVSSCFSLLYFLERYCEFTSVSLHLNLFSMLQHPEREFILKFSAIEIYNEAVRDLLSHDPTPLRLLDDPEVLYSSLLELTIICYSFSCSYLQYHSCCYVKQKGTTVERLTEETLKDYGHLRDLLPVSEGAELNLLQMKEVPVFSPHCRIQSFSCSSSKVDWRNCFE